MMPIDRFMCTLYTLCVLIEIVHIMQKGGSYFDRN